MLICRNGEGYMLISVEISEGVHAHLSECWRGTWL